MQRVSGQKLLLIGIVMNVVGRGFVVATPGEDDLIQSSIAAIWMLASVVVICFGLYRIIAANVQERKARRLLIAKNSSSADAAAGTPPIPPP